MAFSAKEVQVLRQATGAGMMDCKQALVECDANIDKAIKKGLGPIEEGALKVTGQTREEIAKAPKPKVVCGETLNVGFAPFSVAKPNHSDSRISFIAVFRSIAVMRSIKSTPFK